MPCRIFIILCLFSLSLNRGNTQVLGFTRVGNIEVEDAGQTLKNPWVGGLNAPQFSPIDFNGDGLLDIFIFEKTGNKVYTFINEGIPGIASFQHTPIYESFFPKLNFWALLRDFDQDGKPDLFSSAGNGIKIHQNNGIAGGIPEFELIVPLLNSNYSPFLLNLYVSPVDLPAVADIDGDGDLDILTFYILGTCVEYHRNMSVENLGNTTQLDYRLETLHWGNFTENMLTNEVNLNDSCGNSGFDHETNRHSGSALTTFESEQNGLQNLLLGGIGYPVLNFLKNGGTPTNAQIISSTFDFPPSQPVDLNSFPASFLLDVNNDGKRDLIVAPNTETEAQDINAVLLYLNQNEDLDPDFSFEKNNFLQGEMLDFGTGAYPVFFDFDSDGDLDLFIGNSGYYSQGSSISQIALYRNIGNSTSPKFRLVTKDFANLSTLNLQNLIPTFGDLDGDGKADMLVGTQQGNLLFFKNISSNNEALFELQSTQFNQINTGTFAAPQLFDFDADGLLDLVIGNRSGKLSYFKNNNNQFNSMPDNSFFGAVSTVKPTESNFGYAVPCFFKFAGETYLFCGSESGNIYAYNNIDNNLSGSFNLLDSVYANINQGKRLGITIADLNSDNKPEMIVGNAAGGLAYFLGSAPDQISEVNEWSVKFYPNPAIDYIQWNVADYVGNITIEIFDLSGRKLWQENHKSNSGTLFLNSTLPNGLYLLKFNNGKKQQRIKKLIIQR